MTGVKAARMNAAGWSLGDMRDSLRADDDPFQNMSIAFLDVNVEVNQA